MPDICPDRNNWRQFCEEAELTEEETAAWNAMAKAIREAEARGDGELFDFIAGETEEEYNAAHAAQKLEGWAGMVKSADARRRMIRAEIAAWERWKVTHPPELNASPPLGATDTLTGKAGRNNEVVTYGR